MHQILTTPADAPQVAKKRRSRRKRYIIFGSIGLLLLWIVIAIIMLISAFTVTKLGKLIVLFCGFALLANMAVMLAFMGWFIGTDMVLASALMTLCGGCCFKIPQATSTSQST